MSSATVIDEARALIKDSLRMGTYSSRHAGDLSRKQLLERLDELLGGVDVRPFWERMDVADAVVWAAMVMFDKALRSSAEVRLARADVEAYEGAPPTTQIQLAYDARTGDVLMRLRKPEADA